MGQSNSKKTYYNNKIQTDLIKEINRRARQLSEAYSYEFLDDNFCNRIALLYNDRLTKFRKQEIDNVQFTLGIVNDDPSMKNKVCKLIVDHYIKRIRLITKIESNLDYCLNRIYALTIGPICAGQPEVFTSEECRNLGGRWTETVLLPDDQVVENKPWFQQVHNMQEAYIGYLKQLSSILRQLDDFDEYINDERLNRLDDEVDKLIETIQATTFERYRMALSIPTYTPEQIRERKLREETIKGDYAAKQSALRVSKGLPPLKMR
jgi:hypothetical protein